MTAARGEPAGFSLLCSVMLAGGGGRAGHEGPLTRRYCNEPSRARWGRSLSAADRALVMSPSAIKPSLVWPHVLLVARPLSARDRGGLC